MQLDRQRHMRFVFVAGCIVAAACAGARGGSSPHPSIPKYGLESVTRDSMGHSLSALAGTVADSVSGRPLGGALVLLTSRLSHQQHYSSTDELGGFIVQRVPPGSYDLLIRKVGYYPLAGVYTLRSGAVDTLRARLRAAPF